LLRGEPIRNRDPRLRKELLGALERARGRLAVAIAAENKFTPRERWRHYLETEDRMRKVVREIRNRCDRSYRRPLAWLQVLEVLNRPLPAPDDGTRGEASALCERLHAVLEIMEK
jgi:hypothetical protein